MSAVGRSERSENQHVGCPPCKPVGDPVHMPEHSLPSIDESDPWMVTGAAQGVFKRIHHFGFSVLLVCVSAMKFSQLALLLTSLVKSSPSLIFTPCISQVFHLVPNEWLKLYLMFEEISCTPKVLEKWTPRKCVIS